MKITDIELHEIHPALQAWNREALKLFMGKNKELRNEYLFRYVVAS